MTDKVDPTKLPLPAGALQLAPAVQATAPTTRTRLAARGATSFESDSSSLRRSSVGTQPPNPAAGEQ